MTDWNPDPWPIDPEHGRVTGPGYLGDSFHSLRVRELFRYYQPPTLDELHHVAPINLGNEFVQETGLISAVDPILAAFANLVCRVMDMRRCIVSMTGAGTSYIVAESTRTLSLTYPHTHSPEDGLMLGGGTATSSLGGLCEHTCSLLPPPPDSDEPFLLEIPDLSKHPKFCNVGYVRGWPHARFYCGAPLRTKNGVTIGTVCVMDERTRYGGLTARERLTMSSMADMFMQYFETKESSRFRKRGQIMEAELSRFISEGYMPSEGTEMAERRNGRLWNENILKAKREREEKRRQMVSEKRQMLQDVEYSKMMKSQEGDASDADYFSAWEGTARNQSDASDFGSGQDTPKPRGNHPGLLASSLDSGISPGPHESLVPVLHPLQPGIIEMVPASKAKERASLLETVGTPLPVHDSGSAKAEHKVDSLARSTITASLSDLVLDDEPNALSPQISRVSNSEPPFDPSTDGSSSVPVTIGTSSQGLVQSTTATSTESLSTERKRSKYEETVSMEPHLRVMFARAARVIKNTVDCDVVFVDGDLEGFYEPEYADEDLHATEKSDWSHISSDNKAQSDVRAQRPVQHRQKSGILGYATSNGLSSTRFEGPRNMTDLGFDMSQLHEDHLSFLLKDCKEGRIFSFFDEYPGLEEHEEEEDVECKKLLRNFLPGCRSVITVPLRDRNDVLIAVCFAWTCSDQKTFYGGEEGRFVTGVANSIMDEIVRMQILSADKAKSEFISSISHELRSPLHGILACGEFLIDTALRPDQRSFVETIISCGTTLLDTVNHVLDFQKLNSLKDEHINTTEAPPSPAEDQPFGDDATITPKSNDTLTTNDNEENLFDTGRCDTDFSAIVQEVTEGVVLGHEFKDLSKIFGQSEEAKNAVLSSATRVSKLQVIVDIDDYEGGWVFRSNPAAIKRIVGNLVGNAIKYSHESGWIKVTLAAQTISPAPNGLPRAKISIIVSDSGKGMSREFLKTRLFTPFTQENPMASGAGLGLSIVRQLVDMHNGKIDVKSQLGKGTTFRIEMKLTQSTPKGATESKYGPRNDMLLSNIAGMKVLFIGFSHFENPETPEQRGETLLYNSLMRYARELLHLDIFFDPSAPGADQCEVIIVNELAGVGRLHEISILKERPVIALCNTTLRRSMLDQLNFDRDPRLVHMVRKPCGPKKLFRAFDVCLDSLKNGLPENGAPQLLSISANTPGPNAGHEYFPETRDVAKGPGLPQRPAKHDRASSTRTDELQSEASQGPSLSPVIATAVPHTPDKMPPGSTSMPAQPAPPGQSAIPPTRQPKILCVEDNRINMMLVTTYLKKRKYPYKTACDGAEAVERVKEEAQNGGFDCILMDLQMPVMSGIESTREIRHLEAHYLHPPKRAFIIALTGLAAGSDRHEAFNAGIDAFMVKPVSFKDLEKMLHDHVLKDLPVEAVGRRGSIGIVSVESSRGKNIEIKQSVHSPTESAKDGSVKQSREAG